MAVAVYSMDYGSGGVAVRAAGLVAADGADAAVFVGKGIFLVRLAWTACEINTGDEFYNVQFQFNTAAAASTWLDGPNIAFGNSSLLGGAAATAATGEMWFGLVNAYDNQIRTNTWVTGTIATGMNYTVDVYPLPIVGAF